MSIEALAANRTMLTSATSDTGLLSTSVELFPRRVWFNLARNPLLLTLLLATLASIALQLWRPLYHLTDDNLDGFLPVFVEFSRRLWSGQNPFVSEALFGGGYNFLFDGGMGLLSPLLLLATPIGCTRWYYLAPDVIASLNLITIALAFCWAGVQLRQRLGLKITNGTLVFLSISYAFSAFNLVVNASWIGFINPQAAMPVIFAALYEPSRRRSILLITGATLFGFIGSHMHPFLYMNGFVGLLALFVARQQRSWKPLLALFAGVALAGLMVSPLLVPAMMGFSSSQRQAALAVGDATASRLPFVQLAASALLGPIAAPLVPKMYVHSADPTFSTAIAFSLVNLPLIWMLVRKRKVSLLEVGIAFCIVVAAFLIVRPIWLEMIMLKIPLLRSLRWPFREVADLNFFLHLLALLNLGSVMHRTARWGVVAGTAAFCVIFLGAVPTFSPMYIDRDLIVSGKAAEFWQMLSDRIGEKPRVIVAAHPGLVLGRQIQYAPYSLLGAFNYAALFNFVNVSGYSPTQAGSAASLGYRPYHFGGIYWNAHAEHIWQQHPELTLMELLRNSPAIIRVRHGDQAWIFAYDEHSRELRELEPAQVEQPVNAGRNEANAVLQ